MLKILIIDDDNTIILFMSRMLKNKFDCHVFSAENGLEALTILEDEEIDLIFSDVTMPIMDGVETLRAIRKSETLKDIPVVMLSAIADKKVIDEVKELNVYSYMLKPLTYEFTYKALKKIIDSIEAEKINANSFETLIENEIDGRKKIIVIDHDEYFKEKLRIKLSERFIIFDADSGAKGLNIVLREKPDYVFLSDNLKTLSADFIAKKIRNLTNQNGETAIPRNNIGTSEIYLVKDLTISKSDIDDKDKKNIFSATEDEKLMFDEIFVKSSDPSVLLYGLTKELKF